MICSFVRARVLYIGEFATWGVAVSSWSAVSDYGQSFQLLNWLRLIVQLKSPLFLSKGFLRLREPEFGWCLSLVVSEVTRAD